MSQNDRHLALSTAGAAADAKASHRDVLIPPGSAGAALLPADCTTSIIGITLNIINMSQLKAYVHRKVTQFPFHMFTYRS